jgi:hypothetical protein
MTQKLESGLLIQISACFGGGDRCIEAVLPIERLLRKVTRDLRAKFYLSNLSSFELWFRVAGTLMDFDGQNGPRRLATGRNPPRLLIDLVVAKRDYEDVPQEEFRQFSCDQIERCFELILARALRKKAVKDEARLRADFALAMKRFRVEPIPPYVPLGTEQTL